MGDLLHHFQKVETEVYHIEVCGFIQSRLCIVLVQCASRCLRWDCNPRFKPSWIPWGSLVELDLDFFLLLLLLSLHYREICAHW